MVKRRWLHEPALGRASLAEWGPLGAGDTGEGCLTTGGGPRGRGAAAAPRRQRERPGAGRARGDARPGDAPPAGRRAGLLLARRQGRGRRHAAHRPRAVPGGSAMKQERRAALHQIIEGLGGLIELRDIYDEAIALEAEIRSLTGTRDALHAAAEQARTQAAAERARAELSRREADGVVAENQRRMRESAEEFAAQEDQQDAARAQHAARETAGDAGTGGRRGRGRA